jgi:hypothetical protein
LRRIAGFKFHERRQLFIGSHNETLFVVAIRVCNPDCWPAREFASLFVQSRAYQMSVTLPATVIAVPLRTRIVSGLAVWMLTWWLASMNTMPAPDWPVPPLVMAAPGPEFTLTHIMALLGICNKFA